MTEANVQSYPTCSKRLILKANEKAVCSTDNHPKRIALDVNILQRLQSCSSLHWKVKNSQLSCHLTLNIDKTSLISHLHHGSKAPLTSYKFPPLSKVLLVDRADDNSINSNVTFPPSPHIRLIICCLQSASGGRRNGGAAEVITRGSRLRPDVITPSKEKVEPLPAPMTKKQLPWNLHYPGHSPMTTIIQSPYSFAQTVIPCVKPSSHPILQHSPSTIPSTPCRLQSLSSGSLATLPFQVTFSLTQQPKKPPLLPQTQFSLFLYLFLFKPLTRRFVMLHQYTNGLLLYKNI